MKKLIALLACLCLLLPMSVYFVAADSAVVDAPVVGTAYKFGMVQENVSATDVYYLVGGMNGYYMATGADASAAIDVYLEATEGGYYMYTLNGATKTYINMVVSGTHVNGAYEAAASTVYTYDAAAKTVIANVDGADYWFGTRNDNTYTTVGPVKVEYNGFYCKLYTVTGGTTPDPEQPEEPETPDVPVVAGNSADFDTIVTSNANGDSSYTKTHTTTNGWVAEYCAIQAGGTTDMNPQFTVVGPDNTHKAVCMNGKTSAPGKITSPVLTGGISKLTINYTKMFTDTILNAAITITDKATGNTYTNEIAREEEKNTKYVVWTFDWVLDTPITGDFTIEILNTCPTQQNSNKDRLTVLDIIWESAEADEPIIPDEPIVPDEPENNDPAADSVLTIPQANELGLSKDKNTYTEGKYYVTGKIAAVSNSIYGNMYIVDEDGNQLMIYGTYSADGETRYDGLEYMPVAGDTITVYGIIGTYNGSEAQMKNGWITEIVKGDGEPENTDPAADSTLTVKEAIDLGLSKLHNVFTENKYYVTGEITEIYSDIYGNMKVKDADGNILTIYGTYDADGTNRFDAMETQPKVGDTVKLYGIIGQYNNVAQMKNGWIIAINPETPVDPDEPTVDPDEPTVDPDEPTVDLDEPTFEPVDPNEPTVDTDPMGENMTLVIVAGIIALIAGAAVVLFAKKRA